MCLANVPPVVLPLIGIVSENIKDACVPLDRRNGGARGSAVEIAEAYRRKKRQQEQMMRAEDFQKAKNITKLLNDDGSKPPPSKKKASPAQVVTLPHRHTHTHACTHINAHTHARSHTHSHTHKCSITVLSDQDQFRVHISMLLLHVHLSRHCNLYHSHETHAVTAPHDCTCVTSRRYISQSDCSPALTSDPYSGACRWARPRARPRPEDQQDQGAEQSHHEEEEGDRERQAAARLTWHCNPPSVHVGFVCTDLQQPASYILF